MARSASFSLKRSSGFSGGFFSRFFGFLPQSWQEFLYQRFQDAFALSLMVIGACFLASLISYHPEDPSLNTASIDSGIHNWIGKPGAIAADIALQTLGLGSFVFGLGFIVWGARLWRREYFGSLWVRGTALIFSSLLLSIAFAHLPSGGFMVHHYLGGSGGTLLLNMMAGWITDIIPYWPHALIASLSAILGVVCLMLGIALKSQEREAMLKSALNGGVATIGGFYSAFYRVQEWLERVAPKKGDNEFTADDDEDDEESDEDDEEDSDEFDEDSEDEDDEEEAVYTPRKKGTIEVVRPAKREKEDKKKKPQQAKLALKNVTEFELPALDLLDETPPAEEEKLDELALRRNAEMLQNVLKDFNVKGDIVSIHPGPVVTLYELEPAPGTKTSRVVGLSDDIARSMSAVSVRVAVVPGRNVIGIELPNKRRQTVFLRDLLESRDFDKNPARLPLVLGKDISGKPIIADLARMPHLLVAGTTGSGKSVAVNTMILSLLYRLSPEKCRFIMIDPKMLELSVYDDIPHLLSPVVTEPGRAIVALKWTVQEMENRYRNMSKLGVRNIEGYNARLKEARKKGEVLMRKVQTGFDPDTGKPVYEEQPLDLTELPYIVVVVDEFADLMLVAGKDVENAIQRLAQMARAAGIHLIMATQRPSVDVITGVIKANFPTRISFQVTSKIDSRTILGEGGAETLLGMGDMLYMAAGGRITRVHGPFVSDGDVESVVSFLKSQGSPSYLDDITEGDLFGDEESFGEQGGGSGDELYDQAVALVAREQKASTSFIQRHLQIGYNRAATIIEKMEKQGVVGPANHVGKREVLVGQR